ncbi:MAG: thiamine pyrophosphate-binding protein [Bacteroidetes bacterium]|nr:thiamine pyrophosphate-binding protein [Bacteroidota bacterium]
MCSVIEDRKERARSVKIAGTLWNALQRGGLEQFQDITVSEALVLGLLNQGVSKYIGIFGHGSTDVAEVLRVYQEEGLVKVFNVRNEIEASHAAVQLRWQYNERAAVITSIGPGALQAFAASLVSASNGLGVYYIFGDETTHNEGPNMQQIPGRGQDQFLQITSVMGTSYSIGTPESIFTALKRGYSSVFSSQKENPCFLLLPMNVQGAVIGDCNLAELPSAAHLPVTITAETGQFRKAAEMIRNNAKITVKAGGGARNLDPEILMKFLELSGAVYVHGPQVPGLISHDHARNMTVGGSKGSISGNFAMEQCELLITIGARGVCQWDSSGTVWKKVNQVISINTQLEDALQYNRTLPLLGDCEYVLRQLNLELSVNSREQIDLKTRKTAWQKSCVGKKDEWLAYKQLRWDNPVLFDEVWGKPVLTQPAALRQVIDFADQKDAAKIFDAGDVQANGFQALQDTKPRQTFNDSGSSYMGYAVSALLASGIADQPEYSIAFTGDGSFMMNPQILLDAVQYGVRGMIVLFDNRRMAAISGLQTAQYGQSFATSDQVAVDYVQLAGSFEGVLGLYGGESPAELKEILETAYQYQGLSLIHLPVYSGSNEFGGLGVFGNWNVGNWCESVQKEKHRIGL